MVTPCSRSPTTPPDAAAALVPAQPQRRLHCRVRRPPRSRHLAMQLRAAPTRPPAPERPLRRRSAPVRPPAEIAADAPMISALRLPGSSDRFAHRRSERRRARLSRLSRQHQGKKEIRRDRGNDPFRRDHDGNSAMTATPVTRAKEILAKPRLGTVAPLVAFMQTDDPRGADPGLEEWFESSVIARPAWRPWWR